MLHLQVFQPNGGSEFVQLILPAVLKHEILNQLHQEHGYQGIDRTMDLVRQRCYWPGMAVDIKQWVQECKHCQVAKASVSVPHSFMDHLLASKPNKIVAIDFTLLEPSCNGVENVLIMTDVFSKFSVAVPTWDQRAPTIAQVLLTEWFYNIGVPSRLLRSTRLAHLNKWRLIPSVMVNCGSWYPKHLFLLWVPVVPWSKPVQRFRPVQVHLHQGALYHRLIRCPPQGNLAPVSSFWPPF